MADVALGQLNWPPRVQQISNSYHSQFQLPVLFYVSDHPRDRHASRRSPVRGDGLAVRAVTRLCTPISTPAAITSAIVSTPSRVGVVDPAGDVADLRRAHHAGGLPHDAGARLAAAIEVFGNLESERRPAADALKSWGLAHRFAGSGDRAAIAGLVYDALRRRASSAFIMGADTPRAILLGMLKRERGLDSEAIAQTCRRRRLRPGGADRRRAQRLDAADMAGAPAYVAGDYPEWLEPHFARAFGDARAEEGAALAVARAARSARQHAEGGRATRPPRMLSDLEAGAGALVALGPAHAACPPTPRARRSMPSPLSSKA